MTHEATFEALDVDYTAQLDLLIQQGREIIDQNHAVIEQMEQLTDSSQHHVYLDYLPHVYNISALILGTIIVYILFRLVVSFLSRVFSDRCNY